MLSNLVGLFLLIGVGFAAVRGNLIPSSAAAYLTTLMMKITLPATIFSSMIRPFETEFLRDALTIIGLTVVIVLLYTALSKPMARLFRVGKGRRGMWRMSCIFCNSGFMGFPIAYALFGDEGLTLAVMMGIPLNILFYTIGLKLILLDREADDGSGRASWGEVLFSAVNFSTVLGLVFYVVQIPIPGAVLMPIQYLSNITTPLSMFVIGMNLANGKLADTIRDRDAASASLVRLLAYPMLTRAIVFLLPVSNPLVTSVLLITLSMPGAATSVILAEEYHGCAELGARMAFLSSLLCIVTIPLVSLLL